MEYIIGETAYAKMIFHAAKYPHFAVNGVLLGEEKTNNSGVSAVNITDAIPLFHQCLYTTPMVEVALPQVEAYAESQKLIIVGYYAAAENFNENTVDKAPAGKIADKILEYFDKACFVVLDNRLVCLKQETPALHVYGSNCEGNTTNQARWSKAKYRLEQETNTLAAVSALLKRGAMRDIIDFDNHLDEPENDWTNIFLNRDLKQLMAMY